MTGASAGLADDLRRIATLLERQAEDGSGPPPERPEPAEPSPLDLLCLTFGLSPFERDVLLFCAGMELDAEGAALVARLQDGGPPTFALALAALPEAHWSALLPTGPLRYWRLVELADTGSLVGAALRIDERVLHYLLGLQILDERLGGKVEVCEPPADLVPSHRAVAERIAALWAAADEAGEAQPLVQLCGGDFAAQSDIAAAAAELAGGPLLALHADDLPEGDEAFDRLLRAWERESLLVGGARMIVAERAEGADPVRDRRLDRCLAKAEGPMVLSSTDRRRPGGLSLLTFDIVKPPPAEQLAIWSQALGGAAEGLDLRAIVHQFDLDLAGIRAAAVDALATSPAEGADGAEERLAHALWDSCRNQARRRLEGGVERIEPAAGWDDIVLPERERGLLDAIVAQVRHRPTVHGEWGFVDQGTRGAGLAALFAGPSGTGKTLAAEVIAGALRLDLYRIDLSAVVSKYIGETEKNLQRVFDAAEAGGAVLLFDEADALFGKRSEVKDSHDRHANVEVAYLLQRIESYRGLAILTTNLKDNLDQAFLRRLRFVVQFPFPDAAQRERIWARAFPEGAPLEGVEPARLAQLNVTGGSIRNIALNAAFHAAAQGGPITMAHIESAARAEYLKLEKTLTEAETRGWR